MRIRLHRPGLRARLTLAFATGMAVVLAGVGAFVYHQLGRDLVEAVDMGLQSRAQAIVASAHRAGPLLGVTRRPLVDADEAYAQVLTGAGRIVETTPAVSKQPLLSAQFLVYVTAPTFVDRNPRGLDPARLLAVPVASGGRTSYVVVGATLSNSNEARGRMIELFEIAFPAALVVCSLIGWMLAGAALRPVERMRKEADRISADNPSRRLPVPTTDDTLTRLAATLNRTFDRLQTALERERRFVDDASHELRTPLTILKAEVDSALAGERSRQELERALEGASEEVEHLVRIAEGLLALARSAHGRIPLHLTANSLVDLVGQCARSFDVRAESRGVRIETDVADAEVRLDRTRIRQALDNLIDNALRHAPPGGTVRVAASISGGELTLVVEDSGSGFAPSTLERAFQPFNTPAGGDHAGTGLGLAIVSTIAAAHGGVAHAGNVDGGGARVTLVVPLSAPRPPRRTRAAGSVQSGARSW